jgi:hypothetical protein
MTNEAIVKELRNALKVAHELTGNGTNTPYYSYPFTETETAKLPTELRKFAYDYAMENGKLTSVLCLAADIIEALLIEREQ